MSRDGARARIVFLLQDLKYGGTQRQALELAGRLDKDRFKPEVWLMMGGEDFLPLAKKRGLDPKWLSRAPYVGPGAILALAGKLRSEKIDLLLPLTAVPNIWGRVLGRLFRVPVVVGTCRGGGALVRQHERFLWRMADHHLCNAQRLKDKLVQQYRVPQERITVIRNGVDLDFFASPPEEPLPNPGNNPVVLCVARLVPDKDHQTLLKAFSLLAPNHPSAELWLVGDGEEEPKLKAWAETNLPGAVRFIPGQSDLRPYLDRASILALSSITEALPNVVLEGMAAGLPVAATRVGGLPELVEHGQTGLLSPAQDPDGLAQNLSQLLADPIQSKQMGQAGKLRAQKEFSFKTMALEHNKLFDRLLSRRER